MFVDYSLFCNAFENIKHAMAASIEALYIVLGYPNVEIRQSPLSLDKYHKSICGYNRQQLGRVLNTRSLGVGITEEKRIKMVTELSNWPHKKRKSFTLLNGVTLLGGLEFWATTSPWARFLYISLRVSVNKCLHNNNLITKDSKKVKEMIKEISNLDSTCENEIKEKFIQRKICKEIYDCKERAFIDKNMRSEIKIMKEVLSNPNKYKLETPIAHIILREPDFITVGDSCLEAAGAKSDTLKFWWHIEYPEYIKVLTLKRLKITRRCKLSNKLISINLLEFVVEIISYAAVTVLFKDNPKLCSHPYPLLLNKTDNKTSEAWIRKAATKTVKGSALQRILCILMINNPVGLKAEYIEGVLNIHADAISRTYSKPNKPLSFHKLFRTSHR